MTTTTRPSTTGSAGRHTVAATTIGANGVGPSPEDFVSRHGASLYRYAFVLTGHRADAQDLVQSALLKALRHWDKVAGAAHPEAYVRRIVTTTFLSWRQRSSAAETPVETAGGVLERLVPPAPDPAAGVVRSDELARLVRALPPRMRTVVVLRYYLDLDDATIADELGIGRVAVRSTASRAPAPLRGELAAGVSDPDGPPSPSAAHFPTNDH